MAPHISQPVCASLETESDLNIHLPRISLRGERENLHRKHSFGDILRLIIGWQQGRTIGGSVLRWQEREGGCSKVSISSLTFVWEGPGYNQTATNWTTKCIREILHLKLHHLSERSGYILREIRPGQARLHRETEAEFQFWLPRLSHFWSRKIAPKKLWL